MSEELIKRIDPTKVSNPALKGLIEFITANEQNSIDIKQISPSPQIFQSKFSARMFKCAGHTDHTDYNAHNDTSPGHSDYCD